MFFGDAGAKRYTRRSLLWATLLAWGGDISYIGKCRSHIKKYLAQASDPESTFKLRLTQRQNPEKRIHHTEVTETSIYLR